MMKGRAHGSLEDENCINMAEATSQIFIQDSYIDTKNEVKGKQRKVKSNWCKEKAREKSVQGFGRN
jgi:hypothetical protein